MFRLRHFAVIFILSVALLTSLALVGGWHASATSIPNELPTPLPDDCSGVSGLGPPSPYCALGYVYADGAPVEGAAVTVASPQGQTTVTTRPDVLSTQPYYGVDLKAPPLSVALGDPITVSVLYRGHTSQVISRAIGGAQHLDVILPTSGVDLLIQGISTDPDHPDVNQPVSVTAVIQNQGDAGAGGFYTYLYVDPPERPPTASTPDTSLTYIFGLEAGRSYSWSYIGHVFQTEGVHHICAWVDRDNDVTESDEDNNLLCTTVQVGQGGCEPDPYEPGDNACSAAPVIATDGTHQQHNLCPTGDVDWVKFTAQAGITYTIEASNPGADANIVLSLLDRCEGGPSFGTGQRIVWVPETSGVYYIKARHHDDTYGPDNGYELSVTASTDCPGDAYEPDDECTTARDIPTDGSRQTHRFCRSYDQDWLKFDAVAGGTYTIVADHVGANADPIVELRRTCDEQASFGHGQRIHWTADEGGTYYLRIRNHAPEIYGPTTNYDIRIETDSCQPDGLEPDNGHGQARSIQVDGAAQTHNICPAGDEDWVKFDAQAGRQYTAETFNLGSAADPRMCLYDQDGTTQLLCDDDGTGSPAARFTWQAPASGSYYIQVTHHDASAAGPETRYDLKMSSNGCDPDGYESDNSAATAKTIGANGAPQTRNFCPAGDEDWVKFSVSAGPYIIETSNLGAASDTMLYLYDQDGSTELAQDDDGGEGKASRIQYNFTTAGTYYVKVRHHDPNRYGANTNYDLSVRPGSVTPTPTPSPTPSPTPTPTPPPSGIKTLIVTNRHRLEALYGTAEVEALWGALQELANHPRVRGLIVQADAHNAPGEAYNRWEQDLLNTDRANEVAGAVRNLIFETIADNPGVEYIVIVGDDAVVPFRRTLDRTQHPESEYAARVSGNTTQWAALRDDMTLTDDYYADREPTSWQGHELYLPDYAIGRLVETPAQIKMVIQAFLARDGRVDADRALVTGYDFVQDAAQEMCQIFQQDMGGEHVDCSLIGDNWASGPYREKQLNAQPRFSLQSINGHANHTTEGAPQGAISASEIANGGRADLSGAVIFTVGCHSGFNDTGSGVIGLDLPEAFARQKANYVANTGFGWGYRHGVGLSEALMRNLTRQLMTGGSASIGKALMKAKQRYYESVSGFNDYAEKILIESTLYGLPMYELSSPAGLGDSDEFPSASWNAGAGATFGNLQERQVNLQLAGSFAALDEQSTLDGSYYTLDDHVTLEAGAPAQPLFFGDLTNFAEGAAHGAALVGGHYRTERGFDPVIAQPANEYVSGGEPAFAAPGWYPAVPQRLRRTGSEETTLAMALGQYSSAAGAERLYDSLSYETFHSNSGDWDPPDIAFVGYVQQGALAYVKVSASDPSGIHRVVIAYSDGQGTWRSTDLIYDPFSGEWIGTLSATEAAEWFVQVVDGAGNVAVDDNKGAYYRLQRTGGNHLRFLPLTVAGR
ncbi:MAG TPA: hypothetical protein EYP04_03235 [Anaerolineae bacterium]|nr:hypothetical protein [Anaerolineae bacterium]